MIWARSEKDKDDKRNKKLKVEYSYPEPRRSEKKGSSTPVKSSATPTGATASERVDALRDSLAQFSSDSLSSPARGSGGGIASTHDAADVPGSPKNLYSELQALKAKYEAVVEYTVHLTAERDMIVSQLEVMKREYSQEIAKKKSDTPKAGGKGDKGGSGDKERVAQQVRHPTSPFLHFLFMTMMSHALYATGLFFPRPHLRSHHLLCVGPVHQHVRRFQAQPSAKVCMN